MSNSNFYQYVPDSILLSKPIEEIQSLIQSTMAGPSAKGFPISDLCLDAVENFPPNLKFLSNMENKSQL